MESPRQRGLVRRQFLRGMGISLTLPWLESLAPRTVNAASASERWRPRMVCCYVPNGVNIMRWVPESRGSNYTLSPTLAALKQHKSDFSVLSGLGHPNSQGGHSGADTWLTAADLHSTPGYDYRNSISIDQVVASVIGKETRIPSLQLSSTGGTGPAGHSHTLSFSRDAVPLPAESQPRAVFHRLFVTDSPRGKEALRQRFTEDRSVLDYLLDQSRSLERKLARQDRQKLDEYMTSVREVEGRVKRLESWIDVPKPVVDASTLNLNVEPRKRGDRASYFRTMFDLITLALQTDVTRVCTFQLGREAGGGDYTELGLTANHHELSHHGGDPGMLDGLAKIDEYLLAQFSHFLSRLASIEERGTSLLDQTMLLYGSGMNSGEGGGHSPKNLPLLFAGGTALGIRQGQHLRYADNSTPLSNLFVTMLRSMRIPIDRFVDSTGPLEGLA